VIKKRTKTRASIGLLGLLALFSMQTSSIAQTMAPVAVYPNSPTVNTRTTYGYPSVKPGLSDPFASTAAYPNGVYQVAQLPPQAAPPYQPYPGQQPGFVGQPPAMIGQPQPGYPVPPPQTGYVPQNYTMPPGNPYYNPYQNFGKSPAWTAHLAWIYMNRTKSQSSFPLLVDNAGGTLVDAKDLDYGWQSGFDAGVSRRNRNGSNFELRYFQIDNWNATLEDIPFVADNAIATNPNSVLFDNGTVNYQGMSKLRSAEFNFVDRQLGGERFRFAVGFRWVLVHETLAATFTGTNPNDLIFATDTGNNLWGFQLATDGVLYSNGRFNIVTWGKAGLYANVSDQITVAARGDVPIATNGIKSTNVSYLGESGILGEWEIFPKVSIVGGYQLFYLSGLALAADQLPNMNSIAGGLVPIRLDQSDMFYHGAYAGIDIHF
jgi:hypothetical protein